MGSQNVPCVFRAQQIELFHQASFATINYFPISMLNCTGHSKEQKMTCIKRTATQTGVCLRL